MILGIGSDIVKIDRIRQAIEKPSFLEKYFSIAEREYFAAHSMRAETVAGCFAAKEAVVKAMGTGFRGFSPIEVEIYHRENSRPGVRLVGRCEAVAKTLFIRSIHISISHEKEYAVAVAMAEGEGKE
ncbi:MAG: holo-ACP synthase [Clostridiales bacterium]|nr:holo-ACP synthase [Clostridiales bacterium]